MKYIIVDYGRVVGQSDDLQMAAIQLSNRGRGVLAEVREICIAEFLAEQVLSGVLSEPNIRKPLGIQRRPKKR